MRLIYTGIVADTKDPDGLDRVKVKLTGFSEDVEMPWVRVLRPYASNKFGFVFLPEKDDEVVLLQGDGNGLDQLILIGSVYNGKNKPKVTDADGKNNVKEIRTRSGIRITLTDESGKEKIEICTPDDADHVKLDKKAGQIDIVTTKVINIKVPDGTVNVKCKDANVDASGNIKAKAGKDVKVEGGTNIEIKAGAKCTVKGGASVEVNAPSIKIGGGTVDIG